MLDPNTRATAEEFELWACYVILVVLSDLRASDNAAIGAQQRQAVQKMGER